MTELSIIVPVLNEQSNITPLLEDLRAHLQTLKTDYEVIFVDDGSTDGTWKEIAAAAGSDPRVKGLSLSRNFGHQHALLAGYTFARGRAVVSLDGDLQHPPELIPKMHAAWHQGFKIVHTRRDDSRHTPLFKRLTSRYFYRFFSLLSGIPVLTGSSDFRLIDRQVLDTILRFNDVEFFFRGITAWTGFPATTLPYTAQPRGAQKSKYSLLRMMRLAVSGIVAFTSAPLKMGIWVGFLTSFLAFLELCYILLKYLQGVTVPGWASTTGIIAFLFGILFILLGCIGLYIANIHEALKNRPHFIVNEKINVG